MLARRNWWQTKLVILIGRNAPKRREIVRILSDSMERLLPLSTRLGKRSHDLICCWCQHYEEQLYYLRHTAGMFPEYVVRFSDASLSASARDTIKRN